MAYETITLYNWVVSSHIYPNQPGFFFIAQIDSMKWALIAPLKINTESKNTPLEKEKHLQTINFGVPS